MIFLNIYFLDNNPVLDMWVVAFVPLISCSHFLSVCLDPLIQSLWVYRIVFHREWSLTRLKSEVVIHITCIVINILSVMFY